LGKPFVIRDPVHGYLRVAAHERIVVDHPVTQRLRRITQTGLAELVFPEARTSRFVHSLGAMHLASRFVISALENADDDVAKEFFEELKKAIGFGITVKTQDLLALLEMDHLKSTGGLLAGKGAFRNPLLRDNETYTGLLGLAEAGVRLAALFHDLGHLPYSHDFEFALKAFVATSARSPEAGQQPKLSKLTTGTPHEILGHRLADLVFQGLADPSLPAGVIAAFQLAKDILDEEPEYGFPDPQVGALGWLHSLVDGQVDVDRADYLLRDARALGFEFAGYNLDQLIDNLVLVKHPSLGFITAIDEKGIVALESFCLSRARSNQVLTRHHKSAQIGAAFRFASANALGTPASRSFLTELESILNESSDGEKARALLEAFSRHDDPWWLEIMREAKPSGNQDLLIASRAVILERQPSLLSVWKRKGDLTDIELKEINDLAAREINDLEAFERATRKLREQQNILITIHRFKPFTKTADGSSVLIVRTRNGLRPASEMSSLLQSLDAAWMDDVHMHAFTPEMNKTTAADVISAMKKALVAAKKSSASKAKRASASKAKKAPASKKRGGRS
jgi:HD superfamily phosphohydrolase